MAKSPRTSMTWPIFMPLDAYLTKASLTVKPAIEAIMKSEPAWFGDKAKGRLPCWNPGGLAAGAAGGNE